MLKWLFTVITVVLLAIVILYQGHIEVGSPHVASVAVTVPDSILDVIDISDVKDLIGLNDIGRGELITHTYLWGNDGLFSKEYEIKIYVGDHVIVDKTGLTTEELDTVISSLGSTYNGIVNLITQPIPQD